ncbi:hypothetical protein ASD77_15540 [Pseudoxanthomonas sp. Root65]|nr:hypothetical protein ASD77_15540 [Pseudoxanthomonas sp. Root65]
MGSLFVATATILLLSWGGFLPSPLHSQLTWIWLALFLSGGALIVHLITSIADWWKVRRNKASDKRTSDLFRFGKYQHFSPQEKAVLRAFVDKHSSVLLLRELAKSDDEVLVVRQLCQRKFLHAPRAEYGWVDDKGQKIIMYADHYEALMYRPKLVDSVSKPRTFGG